MTDHTNTNPPGTVEAPSSPSPADAGGAVEVAVPPAGEDRLKLKWGTLKGWDLKSEKAVAAAQKYADFGISLSAMAQQDSTEQKHALCDLIDAIDGEIQNDWSGEIMTKDEAKSYVMNYRR